MFAFFIECDTEIKKLKVEVAEIKKELSALKAKPYETSDMDELDSLFSSLDGSCSSSYMATSAAENTLISPPPPPPLPPKDFLFRPRPLSVPPTITYGTHLAESSPFTTFAANFASDMQLQQPTMATTGPGVPQLMLASASNMNTPVSASTGADYTTSQSGSAGPSQRTEPLPIPSYICH